MAVRQWLVELAVLAGPIVEGDIVEIDVAGTGDLMG